MNAMDPSHIDFWLHEASKNPEPVPVSRAMLRTAANEINRLRDENEQLRADIGAASRTHDAAFESIRAYQRLCSLITAWADAYHSVGITISGTTDECDECDAYDAAIAALRAEVGR